MAIEIERKFLVKDRAFIEQSSRSVSIKQAYLAKTSSCTVRVRISDEEARITIKGMSNDFGLSRPEWEYSIPIDDAQKMFALSPFPIIEKRRYYIPTTNHTWEVDVFEGSLKGLVVAEVELSSTTDHPSKPDWVGREVTGDRRYYNSVLSMEGILPPLE